MPESPEPAAMERRITLRLLAYWEKIRGERAMPAESDLSSEDISDLWRDCFLVHIEDPAKAEYEYKYLGANIITAYRDGISDGDHSLVSPNAGKLAKCYAQVIINCHPLLDEGEFKNSRGEIIKYRQCLLPLGVDQQVRAIFGGMRFKAFPSNS